MVVTQKKKFSAAEAVVIESDPSLSAPQVVEIQGPAGGVPPPPPPALPTGGVGVTIQNPLVAEVTQVQVTEEYADETDEI